MTALDDYLAGRERILGGRAHVSICDPKAAAEQLLEAAGPSFCRRLVERLTSTLR